MGSRRPPCLWLPSKTPPVVLGPEFSESPEENCFDMCLHFNGLFQLVAQENFCAGSKILKTSDSAAFIRFTDISSRTENTCIHLFQRCLLSRYRFVFKNADCFSDVFLQTVLRLLKAVSGQSLGFGVSLRVGLRGCLGQGQR